MSKILGELADVFTGHTFRERPENNSNGACHVIQFRDLNKQYTKFTREPDKTSMNNIIKSQLLYKGDILLASKGSNNYAFLYNGDFDNAVAVSLFLVIRLKTNHISPQFLTWFLNSTLTQKYFESKRLGTSTLNLPKDAVMELEIPIPPAEQQETMVNLIRNKNKQEEILTELILKTDILVQAIIYNQLPQKEHL